MSRASDPIDADRLVAEGSALRSLARALLGGNGGDDVVQDAYLAALEHGGRLERPGAWLTGVVARLAARWRRTNLRRSAREGRVARSELDTAVDPAQIAEQVETLRAIGTAVHELAEPFRTAIILRFWHDVSPREIAVRLGVPAATVRTRLHRGIDRLRARLDAHRGGRDAWHSALLALASTREATAPALVVVTLAGLLMNTKLLLGSITTAALVFVLAQGWPRNTAVPPAVAIGPGHAIAATAPVQDAAPDRGPARELVVATVDQVHPPASETAATDDHVPPWRLLVVVQDQDQKPVADATVRIWPGQRAQGHAGYSGRQDEQLAQLRTDALGRAEMQLDRQGVMVRAERERSISTEHFAWHDRAERATVLTIRNKVSVRGRVVRQDGSGAVRATVTAKGELAITATMGFSPSPPPTFAGDDGAFELLLAPRCRYRLQAMDGEVATFHVDLTTRDEPLADIVLAIPGAISVRGIVVDAEGQPTAAASVRVWRDVGGDPRVDAHEQHWVRTDDDGRFSCELRELARYGLLATAASQPPSDVLWLEPTAERPHADVRVTLPRFVPIAGTVRSSRGGAIANARVHASAGPIDAAARPEPGRRERFTTAGATTTDERGWFELRVHPGTHWDVVVTPDAAVGSHTLRRQDVTPGTRDLVIVATDDELHGCSITGTATNQDGTPWSDFEAEIEFFDEDVLVRVPQPLRATFDGTAFVLPTSSVGRTIAIVLEPPANSPFAPQRLGPFRTSRAGIQLRVAPQEWATVPVRLCAIGGQLRAGLRVTLTPDEPTANWDSSSKPLDADGRTTLSRRAPGRNTLHVVADSGVLHTQPATLLPGANPELVVTLPASAAR